MEAATELLARRFAREGFVVLRGLTPAARCRALARAARAALAPLQAPAEFEADVGYPGAPASRGAEGGQTPRRLLNAYSRAEGFRRWAVNPELVESLRCVMGESDIWLSQCHHNCIMTKYPGHSSETLWHQDVRYWSFDRPELVSAWLALGRERTGNGGLWMIPGSHRLAIDRGRLDRDLFLRRDLEENRELIERAEAVDLDAGDVLLFHCRSFHAAGMNRTDRIKLSLVYTYHAGSNQPIPGTRSGQYPSVRLGPLQLVDSAR